MTVSDRRSAPRRWARRGVILLGVTGLALAAVSAPAAAAPPPGQGEIYVLHGIAGVTADVLVDGAVVMQDADPSAIVGPLPVAPGSHTVTLDPTTGADLTATVTVADGGSYDVVAHLPASGGPAAVLTVYPNDLSAVGSGKARLVVAHTAVVPPADVRVDGAVLFSNVANGESLELMVPAATYSVDIVPTGASTPVVFGPVSLPVQAGTLTRVFAFGDPTESTMNAIVQTIAVPQDGAAAPSVVPTGDGGQVAGMADARRAGFATAAAGLVLLAGVALRSRRPRAARAA